MVDYNRFIDRLLAAHPIIVRYETTFIKRRLKSTFANDDLANEPKPDGAGVSAETSEAIWVNHDSGLVRLAAQDIERVTAEGDYMRIHIGPRSWLIHCTIKQLLEQLDPKRFIRLHRSAIVRRDFVGKLEHKPRQGWVACLLDGSRQRIAKSHVSEALSLAAGPARNRQPHHS